MKSLIVILKLSSPIFVLVGLLHLSIGVGADVLLGARLPAEALSDPVLDSQNRFFGVSFMVYGLLLYLCATDLPRYEKVFYIVLWVFFAAGLARVVSITIHGLPSPFVIFLLLTELVLPPVLTVWFLKTKHTAN